LNADRFAMKEFFAPWSLAAVGLLGLNDHVLKARLHNALTGKLSDIAACFFLPLFLSALLGLVTRWRLSRRLAAGGLATVVVFTLQELSEVAGAICHRVVAVMGAPLGVHGLALTRDPTDLLTMAMVPLGCWYGWRRGRAGPCPPPDRAAIGLRWSLRPPRPISESERVA
jgi:hypothetical protein